MATRLPAFETKEEPERIVKAKPVPHYGVPVAMSLTNKRSTVPQPFSFAGQKKKNIYYFNYSSRFYLYHLFIDLLIYLSIYPIYKSNSIYLSTI